MCQIRVTICNIFLTVFSADRAAKEALDKKTDKQSHALFGSKTFNCQICTSNLAERMG